MNSLHSEMTLVYSEMTSLHCEITYSLKQAHGHQYSYQYSALFWVCVIIMLIIKQPCVLTSTITVWLNPSVCTSGFWKIIHALSSSFYGSLCGRNTSSFMRCLIKQLGYGWHNVYYPLFAAFQWGYNISGIQRCRNVILSLSCCLWEINEWEINQPCGH